MSVGDGETTVVVGGGQAGYAFCAKLRELHYPGHVVLISDERHGPYQRPPLSKAYILGETTLDRLHFRAAEFYADSRIELRNSLRVEAIDREKRHVSTSDGGAVAYDHLVLATGARPRRLPDAVGGHLAGVHYMRTVEDADALAAACKAGSRVLIVGGGYIGLEAAAVARKLQAEVTLIEFAPRILQRVASVETADYFRQLHQSHGVDIRESVGLSMLNGENGRVVSATLSDGASLDIDVVIVGIGVLPNQELAEKAGLPCANGIIVDAFCRTADPRIMAIGDCANIPHEGDVIRLESVGHAIDHAQTAATILTGGTDGYRAKPWFWSDQFDAKLQIAGLSTGFDRVVIRGGYPGPTSHWYYRGAKLLAVDAVNDSRAYTVGKRLIELGRSPTPEAIAEPTTDLKALLRAG